jgi:Holliday junction resolvase RusA-like endonuclease
MGIGEASSSFPSIALWLPPLRARKNQVYGYGHHGRPYLTQDALADREEVQWCWEESGQEMLPPVPLSVALFTFRDHNDGAGDIDHWLGPLLDHCTRAGVWVDDAWIVEALVVRAESEHVGNLLVAWVAG